MSHDNQQEAATRVQQAAKHAKTSIITHQAVGKRVGACLCVFISQPTAPLKANQGACKPADSAPRGPM